MEIAWRAENKFAKYPALQMAKYKSMCYLKIWCKKNPKYAKREVKEIMSH